MSSPAIRLTTTLIFAILFFPAIWVTTVAEGWGRWFCITAVCWLIGSLFTRIGVLSETARNRSPY